MPLPHLGMGVQSTDRADLLFATGCQDWLVMSANGDADWWIPEIRRRCPTYTIVLRPWIQPFINTNPESFGRYCAEVWIAYGSDPNMPVQIGNEYNLALEYSGHESDQALFDDGASQGEGYKRVNDWCVRAFTEFKRLAPNAKLIWGTFSPGHNEDVTWTKMPDGTKVFHNWHGNDICREARSLCDIDAAHAYKNLDYWDSAFRPFRPKGYDNPNDPGGHYWQFPDKPFWITEFNRSWLRDGSDPTYIRNLLLGWQTYPRVEKVFVFLGNAVQGGGHEGLDISISPEILDYFREYIAQQGVTPMPDKPMLLKAIEANGATPLSGEFDWGGLPAQVATDGLYVANNKGGEWFVSHLPKVFPLSQ